VGEGVHHRSAAPVGVIDGNEERAVERAHIERAQRGDAIAFRALVERHHRGVFSLARRMTGDAAEAEDLTQETFARAFVALDDFDSSFRLSTWLYRIALNACRDHLKSPRRREQPDPSAANGAAHVPAPEAAMDRDREAVRVRAALERLSPSYREALVLKDMQGLAYEEIREITGAPVTALKIRVLRARARLRAFLEEP